MYHTTHGPPRPRDTWSKFLAEMPPWGRGDAAQCDRQGTPCRNTALGTARSVNRTLACRSYTPEENIRRSAILHEAWSIDCRHTHSFCLIFSREAQERIYGGALRISKCIEPQETPPCQDMLNTYDTVPLLLLTYWATPTPPAVADIHHASRMCAHRRQRNLLQFDWRASPESTLCQVNLTGEFGPPFVVLHWTWLCLHLVSLQLY